MTYKTTYEKYDKSLLGELTEEDVENAGVFLQALSAAAMDEWSEQRTIEPVYRDQRFRMVVDRPHDGDSNKAVVVGGEFGNGITPWATARARVVRDMVAPEATLVFWPNTGQGQSNMNFSSSERDKVRRGRLSPMIARLAVTLGGVDDPEDLTFYGPSQGGVVSLGYAAYLQVPSAVAAVEAPNVVRRSRLQLAKDFVGSGSQLKDIVRENYDDPDTLFARETLDALSIAGMARFAAGLLHPDNLALAGILRRNSAEKQIATILEHGGSVVQAYGTVDKVSPAEANERLAETFANGNSKYRNVRLEGADHSITNNYALCGALARAARNLL